MRRALDALYFAVCWLAAVFLVGTLVFVLIGIVGRQANFHVRGTDAYAGYCMAAAGFLALAETMRRGEHIRVSLILQRLSRRRQRVLELCCHAVAVLLAGALAWFSARLVWQSFVFHDISQATDATPLWIPQIAMALGAAMLLLALLDQFVAVLRNRMPQPNAGDEPAHIE